MCLFLVMVVHIVNLTSYQMQQSNEPSQPSGVTGVHVTVRIHSFDLDCCTHNIIYQQEGGAAAVSVGFKFYLPAWMLCLRSGAEDGMH